uniref:6-phosphogluconolactonase n=1 Tax=Attheya septentrionalis TaxID=420275 RepID=A0A6T7K7Z1_9STRA|mmetsp:Transcript_7095/g.12734  ORF Transcript_7095/g.12734 Transcript_7095/m.12734 type:complete len:283 (+) Transcript_7095:99-947(+)
MVTTASVVCVPSKEELAHELCRTIVEVSQKALSERGVVTIALSGGSVPSLLSGLSRETKDTMQWDRWHVLLADERCVASTHPDSNLGAIRQHLLDHVPIPSHQIYGLDESLLLIESNHGNSAADEMAQGYQKHCLEPALNMSGGKLDLAILGFGPDGHTCSLFPSHPLLQESQLWVAGIEDSPKPPSQRITLTFPVLNELTRTVVFCGAGASKAPILSSIFETSSAPTEPVSTTTTTTTTTTATLVDPAPFPCSMVRPTSGDLVWIVDQSAMTNIHLKDSSS